MWPVGLVLAALILALGVVRPILKARKKKEQAQLDLLAADEIERPALAAPLKPGEPTPEELRLQQARALAKQNPIAVANIVKTWSMATRINGLGLCLIEPTTQRVAYG